MVGICNGFQVMVKAGILPGPLEANEQYPMPQTATLTNNDSGKFEDRWIHLKSGGKCVWTLGMPNVIALPVAHGEGKFIPLSDDILEKLKQRQQIVFTYVNAQGGAPKYPENPNGSTEHIAGITDKTGQILGLMPHPERHFLVIQHPSWTRSPNKEKFGAGAKIFENGINYVKEKLL